MCGAEEPAFAATPTPFSKDRRHQSDQSNRGIESCWSYVAQWQCPALAHLDLSDIVQSASTFDASDALLEGPSLPPSLSAFVCLLPCFKVLFLRTRGFV